MPKRSLDASNVGPDTMGLDRAQKKTERSHEENQERAYIAASRRADRSIEARVQSARMASEIHKKRTGKGFKISEQIVQAEEMYEEEEDDMPRSYRMLAAHLQTNSPSLNYRVNAYLANRVAMASIAAGMANEDWLQNPINKMFAEQFPDANKHAQQLSRKLSNSVYYGPLQGQGSQAGSVATSPMSPTFEQAPFQQPQYQRRSTSATSAADDSTMRSPVSPPALSPGSTSTSGHTPQTHSVPSFPSMTMDPTVFTSNSTFTSELPMDAKMLAPNLDPNDPLYHSFFGTDSMNYMPFFGEMVPPSGTKADFDENQLTPTQDFFSGQMDSFKMDPVTQRSTMDPLAGGESWESLVDFDCDSTAPDGSIQ